MRLTLLHRTLPGLLALLVAAAFIPASGVAAQMGQVTISTDRHLYYRGDTLRVCYTVAGPGPVTITNLWPDGASQVFLAVDDDGTGDCINGTATLPAGTWCLAIAATSGGVSGSDRTCFDVVMRLPVPSSSGPDCGQVSVLGPPGRGAANSGSQAAEDCFYQAYQQCTPATLAVSISGVDAGIRHTFSLQSSGASCTITDAAQHFVVPRPPQPAVTTTCSGLSRTGDGGLLFSSCGGDDVTIPPGS